MAQAQWRWRPVMFFGKEEAITAAAAMARHPMAGGKVNLADLTAIQRTQLKMGMDVNKVLMGTKAK